MEISELQKFLEKALSECTYFHSGNVTQDCKVFDVDTKEEISNVVSVDTEEGILTRYTIPHQVNEEQCLEMYTEKYATIHPIYGNSYIPVMFHCYGKIEEET